MENKAIYKKLLNIQSLGVGVEKDGNNPHFKSKYMTLDSILEKYGPILSKEKLVAYHETKDSILTTYIVDSEDGSFVSSEFAILNTDPQKRGGEITYGKRYNLGQLLNIMTDEDDDGNKASGDNFKPQQKEETLWLNYNSFKDIVDAGNITEEQIAKIIKEDGYTLSNQAKIAVRHYCDTGEIDKNLFFKSPK